MQKLDNFEEYNNPRLYDEENNAYTADIQYLLKLAPTIEGVIIDLACGTGRATIPLASNGHRVMGVDIHSGMLNEARKKASKLNLEVDWVEQDCTNLNLNVKSNFIYMVGNSFQHFLTNAEQDRVLTSVCNHLNDDGLFVFGTRFPSADELFDSNEEEYWRSYTDSETQNTVDMYMVSKYDALTQIQDNLTIRKFKNTEGEIIDAVHTTIRLRFVFPKEMERTLAANGFEIIHVYEDWDETLITSSASQMIYVCKKIKIIK
ncbi:class I SAM-dependent methyltransferase [Ureibacillus acetophenoni]|uniref:Methyltransferase family protein n=1 Tax=Ureibacillus acetophenoni TaxID=614649 RepID=A0A285UUN7_9BACL|nr:class I SAM-dependent methyltransferase [Ureibacillus acetophenoni]SOC44426.1 methyltransferase family protein [Ureibacillus acetophenoni]